MLDRTTEVPAESKIEIPAISVQYHVGFGETRALTLTTGIELDADPGTINRLLDKIVDSGERQRDRFNLLQAENMLKMAEQEAVNHQLHRQTQENRFAVEHVTGNRRGEWRPSPAQEKVLSGLDANMNTAKERVQALRKQIEELRDKCR
jgi:hypothetical protein